MGSMDMDLNMVHRVSHCDIAGYPAQFLVLSLFAGEAAMLGLPMVVASLESIQVYLGKKIVRADAKAAYSSDVFLLRLFSCSVGMPSALLQ